MPRKTKSQPKYDLEENYEPSESEDEYTEEDKKLLKKVRQRVVDESSEEEVYGFSDDSDSDKHADLADSDVEGKEASDDDLPDAKAWGKKKKLFYNTDYVDEDYGGFGKDEEIARLEEEEAKALQKRLAEQLGDEDFSLDFFTSKKSDESNKASETEITVKSDLSEMSKRQKLQLLKKESPEFAGLIDDFKEKIKIADELLNPIINLYKKKTLPNCVAIDFVQTFYEVILNYCTNLSFYLLLKTKKIPIQNHPVTKRLFQFRQILAQIEPIYEANLKTQLEEIIYAVKNDVPIMLKDSTNTKKRKKNNTPKSAKRLKLIHGMDAGDEGSEEEDELDSVKKDDLNPVENENDSYSDSETSEPENPVNIITKTSDENINIDDDGEKRAITYQMAKNKGLTPRRKKEQRNPRVKHRNKYRKAQIRRKGAVREVRNEMSRYSGEMSGIKSNVKKSIKIK